MYGRCIVTGPDNFQWSLWPFSQHSNLYRTQRRTSSLAINMFSALGAWVCCAIWICVTYICSAIFMQLLMSWDTKMHGTTKHKICAHLTLTPVTCHCIESASASYQLVVNAKSTDGSGHIRQVKAHGSDWVYISLCFTGQGTIDSRLRRGSVGNFWRSSGHCRNICWTHTRNNLKKYITINWWSGQSAAI